MPDTEVVRDDRSVEFRGRELALQVHGQLTVATAVFSTDEGLVAPGAFEREMIEKAIATLLEAHVDCDQLGYASMLVRDHLEALEVDGVGLPLPELAVRLRTVLTQHPYRYVQLAIVWDTGCEQQVEYLHLRGGDTTRAVVTNLDRWVEGLLSGEVAAITFTAADGRITP